MIYTKSKFNYGHKVTIENAYIPFSEGGPELIAMIQFGSYTLGEYALAVQDAFNAAGDLTYEVTVDRDANQILINATGNFELLTNTGSVLASSAFAMMGYQFPAADLTGDNVYQGNVTSGAEYFPQFLLQSYIPSPNYADSVSAIINESSDGRVEVVRFGVKRKIDMDIKFITNLAMGEPIDSNPTGLADALAFLNFATEKNRFEFVADRLTPSTFEKVILESMPGHSDGTGFKLVEMISENLPDIYGTGVLTLRVVA